MKAKQLFVCGLTAFAAIALASCGKGDLADRQEAVKKVANQGIATAAGVDMIAGTKTRLNANNSESLSLAKQSQTKVNGKTYTVKIDWTYDRAKYGNPKKEDKKSTGFVYSWEDARDDDTHLYVSFEYSLAKAYDFAFDGVLTCGDGVTASVHYDCELSKLEITFTEMSHTEFYETGLVGGKKRFVNWQNEEGRNKDFFYNNGHKILVRGKLTYMAPDGNFAYLSNGNKHLALYHCELSGDYSKFEVGKYFEIGCYIATYYGYPQLSNMSQTVELTAAEYAEKGGEEPVLTPEVLAGKQMNGTYGTDTERIDQFSDYHHRMASISGHLVAGSIKDGEGNPTTDGNNRFTFKLLAADGTEVTIQHNYHTDGKGSSQYTPVGQPIMNKLLAAGSANITVTGPLTYSSTQEKAPNSFEPGNEGGWTITPLTADSVVVG